MDQLICAFLSHTHYRYEVGMLKVPASNVMKGESSIVDYATLALFGKPSAVCKNYTVYRLLFDLW